MRDGSALASGDHEHRPLGDLQQLVRDRAERSRRGSGPRPGCRPRSRARRAPRLRFTSASVGRSGIKARLASTPASRARSIAGAVTRSPNLRTSSRWAACSSPYPLGSYPKATTSRSPVVVGEIDRGLERGLGALASRRSRRSATASPPILLLLIADAGIRSLLGDADRLDLALAGRDLVRHRLERRAGRRTHAACGGPNSRQAIISTTPMAGEDDRDRERHAEAEELACPSRRPSGRRGRAPTRTAGIRAGRRRSAGRLR